MHRLQNPDDIEHFRSIVPSQSRRLLDQATVLSAGEAIVLGSAFHVPARVHVNLPEKRPSSRSSTPHRSWKKTGDERFGLEAALKNWLGEASENIAQSDPAGDLDDEIPF
jgi:DNA helicase HerA-like ATPase